MLCHLRISASLSIRLCSVWSRTPSGELRSCSTLPVIMRRPRRRAPSKKASTEATCEVAKVSEVVTPLRSSSSKNTSATSFECAGSANRLSSGKV
ncbi:Uncharacterised protein [Mycobacterium tuberculosis]|nr:Uncharacterised protein [Mycobacterium tuberculosis]